MASDRIAFKYDLFVSYANSEGEDGSVEAIVSVLGKEYRIQP